MDLAEFHDGLALCGVEETAAQVSISDQGYPDIKEFSTLSDKELTGLVVHIAKNVTDATGARVVIPFRAIKKLKAYRTYALFWARQGKSFDDMIWNEEHLTWGLERIEHEARVKEVEVVDPKPPAPIINLGKPWVPFKNAFELYLSQLRGAMSLPLSYVIRDHDEPDDDMIDWEYENSDLQMMDLVLVTGKDFDVDNHRMWDELYSLVHKTTAWVHVQLFEKKKDGRKAWKSLLLQAEGTMADNARSAAAYAVLRDTTFNGKGRKVTFAMYGDKLQLAFNELQDIGEDVSNFRQVDTFIRGLDKCRSLQPVVLSLLASDKKDTFEEANLYIKTIISQMPGTLDGALGESLEPELERNVSSNKKRKISAQKRRIAAQEKLQIKPWKEEIELKSYPNKDYMRFSDVQRAELFQLRETEKARVAHVSAIEAAPKAPRAGAGGAGNQFGPGAHQE